MAGEKILCADDDRDLLNLVSTLLTGRGYRVQTVTDGVQALRLVPLYRPDLVITDFDMPYINGLELARRLREHRTTARIPIILLSGHASADDVLAGYTRAGIFSLQLAGQGGGAGGDASGESDGGTSPIVWILIAIAVVVVIGGGIALARRRGDEEDRA